jgi:hypothetical protein
MNTPRVLLVSPLLLLLAGPASALADVQSTRIFLTRPVSGAPDLDADGSLLIRSYDGGDRERFDVRIHHVLPGVVHELYIEDGEEQFVLVAELEGGKSKKFSADTAQGEILPLEATLAELTGRALEVRVDGEVLLSTVVPAFVDDAAHKSAKEQLDVADGSPSGGAQGVIFAKANDKNGLQFLRLKVKDLGFQSFAYTLWVEDTEGTLVPAGSIEQYGKRKGRYVSNTRTGKPLPLGELYIDDLAGRKLEIRDQNDAVYLEEVVPPLQKD